MDCLTEICVNYYSLILEVKAINTLQTFRCSTNFSPRPQNLRVKIQITGSWTLLTYLIRHIWLFVAYYFPTTADPYKHLYRVYMTYLYYIRINYDANFSLSSSFFHFYSGSFVIQLIISI